MLWYAYSCLHVRVPVACIGGFARPAVIVKFNPHRYTLRQDADVCISLPYRMVFAIASQDMVTVYDTQGLRPIFYASNLHYSTITDLAWSGDGRSLLISSTDGFCSLVEFEAGELGTMWTENQQ